jgi:hypothetical protein
MATAARAKPEITILKSPKTGEVVSRINKKSKSGAYFLGKDSQQRRYIATISFVGFTTLPSGLRRDGNGFASSGYLVLQALAEKFGKYDLTISSGDPSAITVSKKAVTINHDDLRTMLRKIRTIKAERFREIKSTVDSFLHLTCPAKFPAPSAVSDVEYRPNAIADVLHKRSALDNLSKDDINALGALFPSFIERYGAVGSGKKKLFILSDSKRATELIYIRKVVEQFENKLQAKNQNEHTWQEFLRDYILIFNSNYATVLEKSNVTVLGTKYPDFLLIDAYSYLDVYEIKKPSTRLLKRDTSRGNDYWDTEIVKAISQVENYIDCATRNGPALCDEIRRQKKIDVRILKPRGFIIAGTRSQLEDEIMQNSFRLLNDSFKNINVILFDDLLNNLKNFLAKLSNGT